jgi:hypothetical protein
VTRLNWEKRNKDEKPKEKKALSNRTKVLKAYENGAKRERARIVQLLENGTQSIALTWVFSNKLAEAEFKTDDGTDAVSVDDAWLALEAQLNWLLQEIKGEK